LKSNARKYAAKQRQALIGTGGGPSSTFTDVILEKVISIINKKTVFGLENLFDSDAPDTHRTYVTVEPEVTVLFEQPHVAAEPQIVQEPQIEALQIIEEPQMVEAQVVQKSPIEDPINSAEKENWKKYTPKNLKTRSKLTLRSNRGNDYVATKIEYLKKKIHVMEYEEAVMKKRLQMEEEVHKYKIELLKWDIMLKEQEFKKNN